LIYDMQLSKDNVLWLLVTLTYAGCPLSDMIEAAIHDSLLGSGVTAKIQWTFSPPWTIARLTDSGREQMVALGAQLPYT
jgi:metal-sulfur cluster biosynthetic enzyme